MPLISAVNGPAVGIGMSKALMGDIVIAARSAYFLQAFAQIGLIPNGGSTWLLPRLIGLSRAKELTMLAEKLPADKALSWGLINSVFDDALLIGKTLERAQQLADGPAVLLALMRDLYIKSIENSFEEQLDLELQLQNQAGNTEEFHEGQRAFFENRAAVFKGK